MQDMEKPLVLCEVGETGLPGLESWSPFCLKVHRALRAAGLSYASRHGKMPSDFKSLNPAGQVPVLLIGDEPVFDSTTILARILELAPGTITTSAEAWLWEDYADRALSGYLVAARWADERNWPLLRETFFDRGDRGVPGWLVRKLVAPMIRRRVVDALKARDLLRHGEKALWADYRRILDVLEARAPRTGFWLSPALSVADLGLFAQLRSLRTPLTPMQAREIELRPALVDYVDRVDAATRTANVAPVIALRKAS